MAKLRFLVDEDVDVAVMPILRDRGHDVIHAREMFGVQTVDKENMAWARANLAIYLTADWRFVRPQARSAKRSAVLVFRDVNQQAKRLELLVGDVEREADLLGIPHFFMWIGRDDYYVLR